MTSAVTWRAVSCKLERKQPHNPQVGLLALAGDSVIESELRTFLGGSAVDLFTTRVPFHSVSSAEGLRKMVEDLPRAARLLVPGEPLDIIALGCTAGALAIGSAALEKAILDGRPGVAVLEPLSAAVRALRKLGLRRVGLLTPYTDEINTLMARHLTQEGFTICGATFRAREARLLGRTPPTRISPAAVFEAAVSLGAGPVDGVLISCTGLRCSSVVEAIELAIGKPIVTSNQALAWQFLRLTNSSRSVPKNGRLFTLGDAA